MKKIPKKRGPKPRPKKRGRKPSLPQTDDMILMSVRVKREHKDMLKRLSIDTGISIVKIFKRYFEFLKDKYYPGRNISNKVEFHYGDFGVTESELGRLHAATDFEQSGADSAGL